jgi:hypothetical protein
MHTPYPESKKWREWGSLSLCQLRWEGVMLDPKKTTAKKEWVFSNTYFPYAYWPYKEYMNLLLRGYDVPMGNPNPPGGGTDPGIR